MKKIKVCFVILGNTYSGAEIVLNRFLQYNNKIDPYFLLIYKNNDVTKIFEDLYGKEKIYNMNYIYRQINIKILPFIERISMKKTFSKYINIISPELIYINNTTETMLLANIIKYIPNVCHIHDMKTHSRSPIRIYQTIREIKKCSKSITVSKACQRNWGIDMEVIYNGIDEQNFKYRRINKINNIGFVGSLIYRKGVDVLIDSLNKVMDNNKNIKMYFVINDNINKEIEEKLKNIEKKFEERIIVFKNLNEKQMIEFYDNTDLVIVPSRHDPLPTVIMEAISRGTLVVGNNVDGIPELLNNNKNLLFNNLDEKNLAEFISKIIKMNEETINKTTQNLYDYAKEKFSSREKVDNVNKLIKLLIE